MSRWTCEIAWTNPKDGRTARHRFDFGQHASKDAALAYMEVSCRAMSFILVPSTIAEVRP